MPMNAIARVPYFSLYKLKMIQSPDRGLTRTFEPQNWNHPLTLRYADSVSLYVLFIGLRLTKTSLTLLSIAPGFGQKVNPPVTLKPKLKSLLILSSVEHLRVVPSRISNLERQRGQYQDYGFVRAKRQRNVASKRRYLRNI